MDEEISDEEYKKRLNFLLETHECQGAFNAMTWLSPIDKTFWLVFKDGNNPERCTWITYCPYCGYKPEERWW